MQRERSSDAKLKAMGMGYDSAAAVPSCLVQLTVGTYPDLLRYGELASLCFWLPFPQVNALPGLPRGTPRGFPPTSVGLQAAPRSLGPRYGLMLKTTRLPP